MDSLTSLSDLQERSAARVAALVTWHREVEEQIDAFIGSSTFWTLTGLEDNLQQLEDWIAYELDQLSD